jgi:hypothetical protein
MTDTARAYPMLRDVDHESLVIVLSSGGSPLDGESLAKLPDVAVRWQRVEREGRAACVAARIRHATRPKNSAREFGSGDGSAAGR